MDTLPNKSTRDFIDISIIGSNINELSTEIKELQKTIDETDKQIDSLVYKLYNLTDEEIKIVENM